MTSQSLHVSDLINRGIAFVEGGKYLEAINEFTQALILAPKSATIYLHRAGAYAECGNYEQALSDYEQAIALNSKDAQAYINRGYARFMMGAIADAIADWSEAIRLKPKAALPYINRGAAYAHLKDFESAMNDARAVLSFAPNNSGAHRLLALCQYKQGNYDGAIQIFTQIINAQPTLALPYRLRGRVRKAKEDYAGALADYEAYLRLGGGELHGDQAKIERKIARLREKLRATERSV